VSADIGYSVTASPSEGFSFVLSVTPEGTYEGLEAFLPVNCGTPSRVENSPTRYDTKVGFPDLLNYDCTKGYSVDKTAAESAASFTIQCEADGSFSKVPGLAHV